MANRLSRAWKAFREKEEAEPAKPSVPAPTPKWVIEMTWAGAAVLVVTGFLVLIAGFLMWKDDKPPQAAERPSEVSLTVPSEESATAEVEDQTSADAAEGPTGPAGTSGATGVTGPVDGEETTPEKGTTETKAEAAPTEQITGKWPTSPATRNETLALALLATGAALLLAGAFAARITSIKLPGGAELAIAALQQSATVAGAALGAAAEKEGKTEVLKDPEKLQLGVRKLIERMDAPSPEATALRALGAFGAETAPFSSPEQLEDKAKRVLDEIS
jgi:hypothetical protein